MSEVGIYISLAALAITIIGSAIKLTWQVTRVEKEQREYTDAQIDNLRRDMVGVERGSVDRGETLRHETGEVGAALRTKIHDVETWTRDTFVRKDSFEMIIGRLEKSIEKLGDKIEERLDRWAERITKHD